MPEAEGLKAGGLIAVANMKGGVGKTTTVVSLAEAMAAAETGASALVVDLDPQASASICLAGDGALATMIENGRTLQDFLELRLIDQRKDPIDGFIARDFGFTTNQGRKLDVALMPCGPQLRILERELIYALTQRGFSMNAIEGHLHKLFRRDFEPLRRRFDFIIFDCPPGISPFTEVVIRSADVVIVPTIPDRISVFGLIAFCNGLWKTPNRELPSPPKPNVLITRLQAVRQHKEMVEDLEQVAATPDSAFRLLATRVPQSAALASALNREDVQPFHRRYTLPVAQNLAALAEEIRELVHAHRH